jgi:hypothetical protein
MILKEAMEDLGVQGVNMKRPLGLEPQDSLSDCFERADRLSRGNSYSAMMCHSKDLRRIVLLVHEVRKLTKELQKYKDKEEMKNLQYTWY